MTSWDRNLYYHPEKFGLTTVGEAEWSEPYYTFDLTVVWRSDDDRLYWASDSGCSCPSPFEDFEDVGSLKTGTAHDLAKYLTQRLDEMKGQEWRKDDVAHAEPQVAALLAKVMQ